MLTAEKKIKLLELMNRAMDETITDDWENLIKQTFIEDDKWHEQLEIAYYDSDEWYNNIEPLYRVTCTDWSWNHRKKIPYGYIQVYKRIANDETVLKVITVEDAQLQYNN